MTTKEHLHAELERLTEDEQAQLLRLAQQMGNPPHKPGLLSKIKAAAFDGPEDFAANLDLYLSGEKRVDNAPDVS